MPKKQRYLAEFTLIFSGNWVYDEVEDPTRTVTLKKYSLTKSIELTEIPEQGKEITFEANGKKARIKIATFDKKSLVLTGIPKETNMGNVVSIDGGASKQSIGLIKNFINAFKTDGWKVKEYRIDTPNLIEDLLANI